MRIITALLMSFFILPVHAGVVIYGTRIIYPEKNREVLVQLMNQSKNASLIQAWIDDGLSLYTHLRAHETVLDLVCRLLLEKKKKKKQEQENTITII